MTAGPVVRAYISSATNSACAANDWARPPVWPHPGRSMAMVHTAPPSAATTGSKSPAVPGCPWSRTTGAPDPASVTASPATARGASLLRTLCLTAGHHTRLRPGGRPLQPLGKSLKAVRDHPISKGHALTERVSGYQHRRERRASSYPLAAFFANDDAHRAPSPCSPPYEDAGPHTSRIAGAMAHSNPGAQWTWRSWPSQNGARSFAFCNLPVAVRASSARCSQRRGIL